MTVTPDPSIERTATGQAGVCRSCQTLASPLDRGAYAVPVGSAPPPIAVAGRVRFAPTGMSGNGIKRSQPIAAQGQIETLPDIT